MASRIRAGAHRAARTLAAAARLSATTLFTGPDAVGMLARLALAGGAAGLAARSLGTTAALAVAGGAVLASLALWVGVGVPAMRRMARSRALRYTYPLVQIVTIEGDADPDGLLKVTFAGTSRDVAYLDADCRQQMLRRYFGGVREHFWATPEHLDILRAAQQAAETGQVERYYLTESALTGPAQLESLEVTFPSFTLTGGPRGQA